MWDQYTNRVVVTQEMIWLTKICFKQEELVGVIDFGAPKELSDDITRDDETLDNSISEDMTDQFDARVSWSHPIVQELTQKVSQRSGMAIK